MEILPPIPSQQQHTSLASLSSPPQTLSQNDAHVLSALFSADAAPASTTITTVPIDRALPPLPHIPTSTFAELQKAELAAIAPLSVPNPTRGDVEVAVGQLTELIEREERFAAAWADRAMARRLAVEGRGEGGLWGESGSGVLDAVFADLRKAIELATPAGGGKAAVSPFQAKVLAAAHAHRADLYLRAAKAAGETGEVGKGCLQGLGKERLEEMASREFERAAWFGDVVAREMAVRTNPYAKMCGAIVRKALREEMGGG